MKSLSSDNETDAQLLTHFRESNDTPAFAELVRRHGPMVMATARRTLNSQEDVDDAFQATMLALAKASGRFRDQAAVAGWLHKTAYTCAITIQRSNVRWDRKTDRMKQQLTESKSMTHEDDPLNRVADDELQGILDAEIAQLSAGLREVIVRCELEGMPQKDVAIQLGLSTSTVHDRVSKGRKLLRDRLIRRGATLSMLGTVRWKAAASQASAAVTEHVIADVSTKAAAFVAGGSAAEIGIPAAVFQLANKVMLPMMKTKLITLLLSSIAIVMFGGLMFELLATRQSAAAATMLVVPSGLESVEGNFDWSDPDMEWPYPAGTRNQFLISANQFDGLTEAQRLISGYRQRPDSSLRSPRTIETERVRITLSTTSRTADNLSMTFRDNVGSDETVVYDGPIEHSTENLGPPEGPKLFDLVTKFETPFRYDPSRGNLLVEVQTFGSADLNPVDAHEDKGLVTLFAPSPTANIASQQAIGIPVYEFMFVPEPSTASMGVSIMCLLFVSRWFRGAASPASRRHQLTHDRIARPCVKVANHATRSDFGGSG